MAWSIFTDGGGDSQAVAWAKQLLQYIGAPVTPGNTEFIYQWEKSEGGGGKYNPLDQGPIPAHPEWTTTGQQYGGGAADFASWQAGLMGAAATLNTPGPDNYPAIRDALRNSDPPGARQALWRSGWAASHYGYGASWANTPLPGNASTITPLDPGTAGGTPATTVSATTAASNTCILGTSSQTTIHLFDLLPFGTNPTVGPVCIFSKTNARALLGGMLLAAGGMVTLVGTVVLLRYGLERSGAADNLSRVPGVSRVVKRIA